MQTSGKNKGVWNISEGVMEYVQVGERYVQGRMSKRSMSKLSFKVMSKWIRLCQRVCHRNM